MRDSGEGAICAATDFRWEMAHVGIVTRDEIVADGRLHRCHVEGDRPGRKNGWYVLHLHPYPAGAFGAWNRPDRYTWKAVLPKRLSGGERIMRVKARAEASANVAAQIEANQAKARARAEYIWNHAVPTGGTHPYLLKKQTKPYGAREYKGSLVLPMRDVDGVLHNLQFITASGEKFFLKGGHVVASSFCLGSLGQRVYVAEGFATGASIHQATGDAVLIAFNAGNLKPVAEAFRKKHPQVELVIAADDDRWTEENTGLAKGREAARAVNGRIAVPSFLDISTRPTDFNDLFTLEGAETVKHQLENVMAPGRCEKRSATVIADLRRASDIEPKPIRWLWPQRIPLGKLTLFAGDPDEGKTAVALDLVARVVTGAEWPDSGRAEIASAIIMTAEDNPDDTLVPRLIAAGADLKRVYFLEYVRFIKADGEETKRAVTLADVPVIEDALRQASDTRLVVIDPISAYLSATDSHKNAEVRALLSPLADLAARHGVAIVGITHLNKSGGKAIYRPIDSIGFIAAARAAWLFAKDRDTPGRRLMLRLKCNLAADIGGLAYALDEAIGALRDGRQANTVRVTWERGVVNLKADDVLAVGSSPEWSKRAKAAQWLRETLADGPHLADEVLREARSAGISERTLRRAARELGVDPQKRGFDGPWEWAVPSTEDGLPPESGNLGPSGHKESKLTQKGSRRLPVGGEVAIFDETEHPQNAHESEVEL